MKTNKITKKIVTCVLTISMLTLVFAFPIKTGGPIYSLQGLGSEVTHTF